MRKPKVTNPPERIFLQCGIDDEADDVPWHEISIADVTWHDESIFESDIEYRLVKSRRKSIPALPAQSSEEGERLTSDTHDNASDVSVTQGTTDSGEGKSSA